MNAVIINFVISITFHLGHAASFMHTNPNLKTLMAQTESLNGSLGTGEETTPNILSEYIETTRGILSEHAETTPGILSEHAETTPGILPVQAETTQSHKSYSTTEMEKHCYIQDNIITGSNDNSKEGNLSSVEGILKKLNEGSQNLKFEHHKEIILILGAPGSGKKTLAKLITTDNSELFSEELKNGDFIISDHSEKSTSSLTDFTYPQMFSSERRDVFYVTSEYMDIKSASSDIVVNYFIKQVLYSTDRIKMVFTVDYDFFRNEYSFVNFTNMLTQSVSLIKNISKFENSISLVVTNVRGEMENYSDNWIIKSIGNRICLEIISHGYKHEKSETDMKIVQFLNSIVVKKGDDYPRIAILRKPNECGSLKDLPDFQKRKTEIYDMISTQTNYTSIVELDFNYNISEKSENEIIVLSELINDKIAELTEEIANRLKIKIDAHLNVIYTVETRLQEYNTTISSLTQLLSELNSVNGSNIFADEIVKTIKKLQYLDNEDFDQLLSEVRNHCKYLMFLDAIDRKNVVRKIENWIEPLNKALLKFKRDAKYFPILWKLSEALIEISDIFKTSSRK